MGNAGLKTIVNITRRRVRAGFMLCASFCWMAGCSRRGIRPVDIFPEDMCAHCRMAISDKRCASEFVEKDGTVFKFDDFGCMTAYMKEKQNRGDVVAFFVADYGGIGWINAADAHFVRSAQIVTPMGGGIVAYRDASMAEAAAARYQGKVRSFAEVVP